jgi:hypothetical protein
MNTPTPYQTQTSKRPPRSRGVTLFGLLLIFSSFIYMHKYIFDQWSYISVFNDWPAWLIVLRYSFSWLMRIAGTLAGVGILVQKDIARKLAIAIGWFSMLTIYWKHPYHAFKLHAQNLDRQLGHFFADAGLPHVSFASLTLVSLVTLYICDIIFWSVLIYFFTRPSVKKQFQPAA